jgi:hypothetical protein
MDLSLIREKIARGDLPRDDWNQTRLIVGGFHSSCAACDGPTTPANVAFECRHGDNRVVVLGQGHLRALAFFRRRRRRAPRRRCRARRTSSGRSVSNGGIWRYLEVMSKLAEDIIASQQAEITSMQGRLEYLRRPERQATQEFPVPGGTRGRRPQSGRSAAGSRDLAVHREAAAAYVSLGADRATRLRFLPGDSPSGTAPLLGARPSDRRGSPTACGPRTTRAFRRR